MWCFGEGIGWWSWFGGFWVLIFSGALVALAVWGITRLNRASMTTSGQNVLDRAKERYAKGDISKEDYEQYKEDLS